MVVVVNRVHGTCFMFANSLLGRVGEDYLIKQKDSPLLLLVAW